jgi:hypothetical protein
MFWFWSYLPLIVILGFVACVTWPRAALVAFGLFVAFVAYELAPLW